jgi:hypothetical protein
MSLATVGAVALFRVRTLFNDTMTVAVWTGFHVRLMRMFRHALAMARLPSGTGVATFWMGFERSVILLALVNRADARANVKGFA